MDTGVGSLTGDTTVLWSYEFSPRTIRDVNSHSAVTTASECLAAIQLGK